MKKILLIAPSELPIPAVLGGAVETGIVQLIKENEKRQNLKFELFSYYNPVALEQSKKYKNTTFKYYKANLIDKILLYFFKAINRLNKTLHIKIIFNERPLFIRYVCRNIKNKYYDGILLKNSVKYVIPISKNNKSPIFLQLHNDFFNEQTINANKINNLVYKIISNSVYIKNRIKTIEGINENKIFVNMNCLGDMDFIIPSGDEQNKVINKYKINTKKKNIIFVGRITPQKGIKELLEALKLIKNRDDWNLLVAGGKWFSTNSKNKYYRELETISKEFNNKINFLGYVNHKDIRILYYLSYISVVPSMWEEPAGRVVLEAEAMQTPIIAAESGGLPEYLNNDCAFLIKKDPNFICNLSKKISFLLDNDINAKKMGEKGLEFSKKFTSERYYNEIINIIIGDANGKN